jgi:hypothetical protein
MFDAFLVSILSQEIREHEASNSTNYEIRFL